MEDDAIDNLRRAAIHDAGYCVAALAFGIPVISATIEGN